MSWNIRGSYFENCSCEVACSCNVSSLALPAHHDRCRAFICFKIDEGEADGLDLAGRTTAIFLDSPAQMTDGGWSYGVVVDDGASDEQTERLGAIFGGKDGGPLEAIAGLIGDDRGVERHPIEFSEEGRSHRIRIGDRTRVAIEDFQPEGLGGTQLTNTAIPFNTTVNLSVARESQISLFGFDVDNTGKSGASAPFSWSS